MKSVDARLCVPTPSNGKRNDCFSIRLVFISFLLCVFDGLDAFINSVGYYCEMPTVEIVHDFWVLGNPIVVVVAGVGNVCCYLVCAPSAFIWSKISEHFKISPTDIYRETRESHSH